MKTRSMLSVLLFVTIPIVAFPRPSADNFYSVTNDWYQGEWSNVYELAQLRLAANSNDLVAAHILYEYDMLFSDYMALSNSILRVMRASEMATHPAYTNLYQKLMPNYVWFLEELLPSLSDEFRLQDQSKYTRHWDMITTVPLKLLWDKGMW